MGILMLLGLSGLLVGSLVQVRGEIGQSGSFELTLARDTPPASPASHPSPSTASRIEGVWASSPIGDVYPYFTIFDSAVAAQEGRLAIVYFDNLYPPSVSIVLREPDGSWQGPVALGQATDDHAFPAVAIDGGGYLHVVFGGHANTEYPIRYVRSLQPYDLSAWTAPEVLETTTSSSYNLLAVAGNGTLHLVYRRGGADVGDIVMRSRPPAGPWGPANVLAGNRLDSVVPYQLVAEPGGTLHVAFTWRNDRDAPHSDPSYMRSPDGGRSWETAGGVPLALPAGRPESRVIQDNITHNPGLRLVRDAIGGLHMLYSQADLTGSVFLVKHLAYSDVAGAWVRGPGFATSSFPIGFHVYDGALRVVSTAPGDATATTEYTLPIGAGAWTSRAMDPLPVRSQLATPTSNNVAIPEDGLPWTVATPLARGRAPAVRVAVAQPVA